MHPVIKAHVIPLVGSASWPNFNRNAFGSIMSLQNKLLKHTRAKNAEKLKGYLAFCIQEWPDFSSCPIDEAIIKDAILMVQIEEHLKAIQNATKVVEFLVENEDKVNQLR